MPLAAQEKMVPEADKDGIYLTADKMPDFPGGVQELMKFLGENIKYPVEAQKNKIMGRVIVQFVVMEDGSLGMEQVVRSIDPQLDAEALRVIKLMPKWIPGTVKGDPVKVRFTVPIMFRLNGDVTPPATSLNQNNGNQPDEKGVYMTADKLPEFPGGISALTDYFPRHIIYPAEAQKEGASGRVIVRFAVMADGTISHAKVVRGIHPLLDSEAMRVIRGMPKWAPAELKGEKVPMYMTTPINFTLNKR